LHNLWASIGTGWPANPQKKIKLIGIGNRGKLGNLIRFSKHFKETQSLTGAQLLLQNAHHGLHTTLSLLLGNATTLTLPALLVALPAPPLCAAYDHSLCLSCSCRSTSALLLVRTVAAAAAATPPSPHKAVFFFYKLIGDLCLCGLKF